MRPVENDPPDGSVGISVQLPHFKHLVHMGIRFSRALNVEHRTGTHVDQAHVPLYNDYNNLTLLGRLAKRRGVQLSVQLTPLASQYPLLSLSFPPLKTTSNIVASSACW